MFDKPEFADTSVDYILNALLPNAKKNNDKEKYNLYLDKLLLENQSFISSDMEINQCDTLLLYGIDCLHETEIKLSCDKEGYYLYLEIQVNGYVRKKSNIKAIYLKRKHYLLENEKDDFIKEIDYYENNRKNFDLDVLLNILDKNDNLNKYKKKLLYSPLEKYILFLTVGNYMNKPIKGFEILDNYLYLPYNIIAGGIGFKSLSNNLISSYTNAINNLNDKNLEIHLLYYDGNQEVDYSFTGIFNSLKFCEKYNGTPIGIFYNLKDVSFCLEKSTRFKRPPTIVTDYIVNKDISTFELSRYIIYAKGILGRKKIAFIDIMKKLYDYERNCTYHEYYTSAGNPKDIKYLHKIIKSFLAVISEDTLFGNCKLQLSGKDIADEIDVYKNNLGQLTLVIDNYSKNEN